MLDRYLTVLDVEPTTRTTYEAYIRNHIRPVLGPLPLARLEAETVESFYAHLRTCRSRCGGRRLVDHFTSSEHTMNQRTWSRSSADPRRYRTASPARLPTVAMRSNGNQTEPTVSNHQTGSGRPSGLWTGWFCSGPGRNAVAIVASPMADPASAATCHQRRDGSRPSGNHSTPKVNSGLKPQIQIHDDNQPAASAPGSDPGRSTRPRRPYECAESVSEDASPHRQYSQPSRWPGSRERIRAPAAGKASAKTMFGSG